MHYEREWDVMVEVCFFHASVLSHISVSVFCAESLGLSLLMDVYRQPSSCAMKNKRGCNLCIAMSYKQYINVVHC